METKISKKISLMARPLPPPPLNGPAIKRRTFLLTNKPLKLKNHYITYFISYLLIQECLYYNN